MKVINPDLPEPYCYETDYRNIPREHLNPRIPQGRGIVKWQAFKTLPEQYEQLDQYIEDQNKIEMPLLSNEQLLEIDEVIHEKLEKKLAVEIEYWKEGYIKNLTGFIKKVDVLEGIIKILNVTNNQVVSLPLSTICHVS